jgi:hypothetical protein
MAGYPVAEVLVIGAAPRADRRGRAGIGFGLYATKSGAAGSMRKKEESSPPP